MENPLNIKQEIFDDDFSIQPKSKLLQSLLRCEIFGFFLVSFPQNWAVQQQSKARNSDSKYRQMALVGFDT